MPKFEVTLSWFQYQSGAVVIEAASVDEAEEIAEENRDALCEYLIENNMVNADNGVDDLGILYVDETDDDAEVDWSGEE